MNNNEEYERWLNMDTFYNPLEYSQTFTPPLSLTTSQQLPPIPMPMTPIEGDPRERVGTTAMCGLPRAMCAGAPEEEKLASAVCALSLEDLADNKETFKCRSIVFTCYKREAIDDPEAWLRGLQSKCVWVLGQLEKCPKTQRIHIQGMAYNKSDIAWAMLKGESTWKRKCIAPIKSIEYCTKAKSQLAGPWEFGDRPAYGQSAKTSKLNEKKEMNATLLTMTPYEAVDEGYISWRDYEKLKLFQTTYKADKKIAEHLKRPIDHEMRHEWIQGKSGKGKTTKAILENPDHYLKTINKWFDDYQGQETIIIDDLDPTEAKWMGGNLKRWADKWPVPVEVKHGHIVIRPKKVVVTTQYMMEQLWDDPALIEALKRRFKIIDVDLI
ncbi:replication associated protein [Lake Sarah-associated circular virus-33]|uniref:replication associated protein n=1 Tax=Lake Sarah-associated circular virus-33 TaxID=1685761 RepID=UPI0007771FA8|nr:replication associated protein [Lake Sarah-associated circular virus-33]ALE29731.1 replication associated protein [Lake Sarah-associated circular virus-33]